MRNMTRNTMKNAMKQMMITALLTVMTFGLSACSHTNMKDKEAPCSPMASAGNAPCDLIPINFAEISATTKII